MNATSPQHETDDLDRLFSDFFKARLKQPWPKAPTPAAGAPLSEPSELATTRTAEAPRNAPAAPAKARDNTARARVTLAASVALVLGTGWFLADGLQPSVRPAGGTAPASNGQGFLPNGSADGKDHEPLRKMEQNKAKGDGDMKIDLGNEE